MNNIFFAELNLHTFTLDREHIEMMVWDKFLLEFFCLSRYAITLHEVFVYASMPKNVIAAPEGIRCHLYISETT